MVAQMIAEILVFAISIIVTLNANIVNRDKLPKLSASEISEENVEIREKRGINANVVIDPVAIIGQINSLVTSAKNRVGFMKGVMNSAYYGAQQAYNVMVFNLNQDYEESFRGVKMFHTANYSGVTFGVWIFESGTFRNKGEGGWYNWAFFGSFNRDNKFVTLYRG